MTEAATDAVEQATDAAMDAVEQAMVVVMETATVEETATVAEEVLVAGELAMAAMAASESTAVYLCMYVCMYVFLKKSQSRNTTIDASPHSFMFFFSLSFTFILLCIHLLVGSHSDVHTRLTN